jgi:hypothetical protein
MGDLIEQKGEQVKYEFRPVGVWTDPQTDPRRGAHVFKATWRDTLTLLDCEIDRIGGVPPAVIQIDVTKVDIRMDGMLRANAKAGHPGVIVSFQSKFGPLRYATDAHERQYEHGMEGWQANIRAIALALAALRAVDRYGVTKRGEQYTGWKALAAGNSNGFTSADVALQWMRGQDDLEGQELAPGALYRKLARRMHPDTITGNREDWDRLTAARRLLVIEDTLT